MNNQLPPEFYHFLKEMPEVIEIVKQLSKQMPAVIEEVKKIPYLVEEVKKISGLQDQITEMRQEFKFDMDEVKHKLNNVMNQTALNAELKVEITDVKNHCQSTIKAVRNALDKQIV